MHADENPGKSVPQVSTLSGVQKGLWSPDDELFTQVAWQQAMVGQNLVPGDHQLLARRVW